ncbi:MAG: hypothetical protein IT377_07250 [Polyangiaceae bacterium]|nr:hypothetical protein [Polyangiaceae bacterium]
MSNDKKWKVHGLERALDAVPAKERAGLAAEIEEIFADFDPDDPPGEPVAALPPGTRTCPRCGGELEELTVVPAGAGPGSSTATLMLLDCEACELGFCQTVGSDVH